MHELSLARSIMDIIEEYDLRHHFKKVNSLKLSFGKLSSVEPSALEFAFEVLSKETKAEGASLEFEVLPVILYCTVCGENVSAEHYQATCPLCEGGEVCLAGGTEELKLLELDVD